MCQRFKASVLAVVVCSVLTGCSVSAQTSSSTEHWKLSMISYSQSKNGVQFTYQLKNEGTSPQAIHFATAQRCDYVVSQSGKAVFQYSKSKEFADISSTSVVSKGKTMDYVVYVPTLKQGRYQITFWVTARHQDQPSITNDFSVK